MFITECFQWLSEFWAGVLVNFRWQLDQNQKYLGKHAFPTSPSTSWFHFWAFVSLCQQALSLESQGLDVHQDEHLSTLAHPDRWHCPCCCELPLPMNIPHLLLWQPWSTLAWTERPAPLKVQVYVWQFWSEERLLWGNVAIQNSSHTSKNTPTNSLNSEDPEARPWAGATSRTTRTGVMTVTATASSKRTKIDSEKSSNHSHLKWKMSTKGS